MRGKTIIAVHPLHQRLEHHVRLRSGDVTCAAARAHEVAVETPDTVEDGESLGRERHTMRDGRKYLPGQGGPCAPPCASPREGISARALEREAPSSGH